MVFSIRQLQHPSARGWAHFGQLLLVVFCVWISACRKHEQLNPGLHLKPVQMSEWPSCYDSLPPEGLVLAVDNQLTWFKEHPNYRWQVRDRILDANEMTTGLTRFKELFLAHQDQPAALQASLKAEFDLYQLRDVSNNQVLITGYHAPVYEGNTYKDETYRYPLYAQPKDLLYLEVEQFDPKILMKGKLARKNQVQIRLVDTKAVPYYTRAEIEAGQALAGRNLELVYLKDAFEAFSFHIQGGGFLRLPSGAYIKLNYAESNGQPYTSIGKILIDEGHIPADEISMQAIGRWFKTHPHEFERICQANASYVFYETDGKVYPEITPELYPNGVLGFPVTTRRTIATDKRFFPGGGLAFIQGVQRSSEGTGKNFSAFVLDQDTGGAIRGNHIDWFLGAGDEAEHEAGLLMDRAGKVYFLVPKPKP